MASRRRIIDPWEACSDLARRGIKDNPQTLAMELAYSFPGWSLKSPETPINTVDLRIFLDRLSDGSHDLPIVFQNGEPFRFMTGAEQFNERIAPRKGYYIAGADEAIIKDPLYQDYLADCYHKRNVVELFGGDGSKAVMIHKRMRSLGAEPGAVYFNDIVAENPQKAKIAFEKVDPSIRFTPMVGSVSDNSFWSVTYPKAYKPEPDIATTFAIYGATVCNHDWDELLPLVKTIRRHMRPADPKNKRPADRLIISIDMTRHVKTLKRAYDHYVYNHIFGCAMVFDLHLLGAAHNVNLDHIGFRRKFSIEDHNRIEMLIVHHKEQRLRAALRTGIEIYKGFEQFAVRAPEVILREGEMLSGRMYRMKREDWYDFFRKARLSFVSPKGNLLRFRPEDDKLRKTKHYLLVLEPV